MNKLGTFDLDTVVTGDAMQLGDGIPAESVDLILCDPVYWEVQQYRWLGAFAERVLVPGGALLAQVGEPFWFAAEAAVREAAGLVPLPAIIEAYYFCTSGYRVGATNISSGYTPYIFATKGPRNVSVMNRFFGKRDKTFHAWGDGGAFALQYVQTLTVPGAIVVDPFTGGGTVPAVCRTLGRHYVAFEINPITAAAARDRIANTQVPLLLEVAEQGAFFAAEGAAQWPS